MRELPRTAAPAVGILQTAAGGDRASIVAGGILGGPPPAIYDAAVLPALVQVLAPAAAGLAMAHAATAVRPGGSVCIMAPRSRGEPSTTSVTDNKPVMQEQEIS